MDTANDSLNIKIQCSGIVSKVDTLLVFFVILMEYNLYCQVSVGYEKGQGKTETYRRAELERNL